MKETLLRVLRRYGRFTGEDFDRWFSGYRTVIDPVTHDTIHYPKMRRMKAIFYSRDSIVIPRQIGRSMEWNLYFPLIMELVRDKIITATPLGPDTVYTISNSIPSA